MQDINYIFSKNLKKLRKANGFNIAELAEKISVSDATISRWESGKVSPCFSDVEKLAKLFEVPVFSLFAGDIELKPEITPREALGILKEFIEKAPIDCQIANAPKDRQTVISDIVEILSTCSDERLKDHLSWFCPDFKKINKKKKASS